MFCNNMQQQQQRRANIVTIHNVIVHINILVYLCNLVVLYIITYRHSHIRHLHIKSIYIFGYLLEAFCISLSHQINKPIVYPIEFYHENILIRYQ